MNAGLTIFALESTLKETGEPCCSRRIVSNQSFDYLVTASLTPSPSFRTCPDPFSSIFGRAGTFYPLTLSFVLRNLPMRFVLVWIGMYATNIIFTTNMAQAWELFFIKHLSWRWISVTGPF